jgi:FkbM family methyltransferase
VAQAGAEQSMMSTFGKRLRRVWKRLNRKNVYPRIVEMSELSARPVRFRIHSDTELFRTIGYGGEEEQLAVFLKYLKATDVVYDIGASIGFNAVLTALVCTEGQVLAFEPEPLIRQRLEENIALNALRNLQVLPYALSNENKQLQLFTGGTDTVSPSLHGDNHKKMQLDSITVEARQIDKLIAEDKLPLATVLKIDIEGAEYDALLGAEKLLSGDLGLAPRLLFIEVHPEFLVQFNASVELMVSFLTRLGYEKIWETDRNRQIHHLYQRSS